MREKSTGNHYTRDKEVRLRSTFIFKAKPYCGQEKIWTKLH